MKTIKKTLTGLFILGLMTFCISGCEKYDEGGLISKAEIRLTDNTWKIAKYLRNGTDETSSLIISNYTEDYQEGGALTRSFNDKEGESKTQTGTWELTDDNIHLKIDGVGSIELTHQTGTVSSSEYTITKLTKDEFWYTFINGGDTHEFHLVPN